MATFTKKLYMKNSAGTQQTAVIYSTAGEAGSNYMYATVDGSQGYIGLVATSHSKATMGRVSKSGTTYAISSSNPPAYAYTTMTTAGSGVFTVPNSVTRLRVTCVGGGAGGTYNNWVYSPSAPPVYWDFSPAAGGSTTFGSVTASGATAPYYYGASRYQVASSRDSKSWKGEIGGAVPSQGFVNGVIVEWTSSYYSGAPATPLVNIHGTTICSAGAGGSADDDGETITTGGSGYRVISTINVTPGQQIAWSVGAGGKNSSNGMGSWPNYCFSSGGQGTCPGNPGAILVEYGIGIE